LNLSGKHNASLPVIKRFTRGGLIDKMREAIEVSRVFSRVEVERRALWTHVSAFSGGNQQKIAIAKWLLAERVASCFCSIRPVASTSAPSMSSTC